MRFENEKDNTCFFCGDKNVKWVSRINAIILKLNIEIYFCDVCLELGKFYSNKIFNLLKEIERGKELETKIK